MLKKIISLIALTFIAILTTGCVKYNTDFEISKKGIVKITSTTTIDNFSQYTGTETINLKDIKPLQDEKDKYVNKGYKYEEINKDGIVGYSVSKTADSRSLNRDNLPWGYFVGQDTNSPIEFKKTNFKNRLRVSLVYDPNSVKKTGAQKEFEKNIKETLQGENPDSEQSVFQIPQGSTTVFRLKVPYKPISHNATKVINDYEYEWEFPFDSKQEIKLEYEKTNYLSIIALILIFIATIFALNKNKEYLDKKGRVSDTYQ